MKVTAFNGSPRREGNTSILIRTVFAELEKEGIETELVNVGGHKVRGCSACFKCREHKDQRCVMKDDVVNEWIARMYASDGIILASPTYFTDVTSEMKALIDRAGMVSRVNGDVMRRKVGAAIVAVRRAGAIHTFDTLNHFFLIGQMVIPGSSYWNIGRGGPPGAVEKDDEGMATMRDLGANMAWLLKKLRA